MKNMLLAAVAAGTVVAGSILYVRKRKESAVKKAITNKKDNSTLPARAQHAMG